MSSTKIIEDFGRMLQNLRERRHLTQAQLGLRAGMAAASISHFETGQRVPSLDSLVKLADALEVSADALLGRSEPQTFAQVDPLFLKASHANAATLDTLKRVTAAILGGVDEEDPKGQD